MTAQLFILNNGLRDLRGHYFETSVSIAEAACRAGLRPILGTHATCPVDLFPNWLEVYPIFTTDHWMSEPPVPSPDLEGLQINPYRQTTAGSIIGERANSVSQFIANRFIPLGPWGTGCTDDPLASKPAHAHLRWIRRLRRGTQFCKRCAFYLCPELLYDGIAAGYRTAKRCAPRALRRQHRQQFLDKFNGIRRKFRGTENNTLPGWGEPLIGVESAEPQAFWDTVARRAAPLGLSHEINHAAIFRRDLERFLALGCCTSKDHVLLGTAHPRELLAVRSIAECYGLDRSPTFHLEFRHPLFHGDPTPQELQESPAIRHLQFLFSTYPRSTASEKIRLYTDTEELSDEYRLATGLPFGVLPIPFRAELIESRPSAVGRPLSIAFLGDARDEKGFHWMAPLVEKLWHDYAATGKIRFILQASIGAPEYSPHSVFALHRLRAYSKAHVELVGVENPLGAENYYNLVSAADIVALPYDRNRYRAASSGTLAEAIAGGKPTVVPARSWMSAQLSDGCGEVFDDLEGFIVGVRRIIDNYPYYSQKACARRSRWLETHTADALIAAIAGPEVGFSAAA